MIFDRRKERKKGVRGGEKEIGWWRGECGGGGQGRNFVMIMFKPLEFVLGYDVMVM